MLLSFDESDDWRKLARESVRYFSGARIKLTAALIIGFSLDVSADGADFLLLTKS